MMWLAVKYAALFALAALALAFAARGGTADASDTCGRSYVVAAGDSLLGIASLFDTTVEAIMGCNPEISDPDLILVDQLLLIPGEEAAPGQVTYLEPVDKAHALPSTYVPPGLAAVNPIFLAPGTAAQQLTFEANAALSDMLLAASIEGHSVAVSSAYRSFGEQAETFQDFVDQLGLAEAERVAARPGHSEHQLGTTVDLTGPAVGYQLIEGFGGTAAGQWLIAHAAEYGFAMSYPPFAEEVTGYSYEPWHWRYLGPAYAGRLADSGLTLGEFLLELTGTARWGDLNCSGFVDIGDAIGIARNVIALGVSQPLTCPPPGADLPAEWSAGQETLTQGDIDCSNSVTIGDAVKIARSLIGLDYTQEPGCLPISAQYSLS